MEGVEGMEGMEGVEGIEGVEGGGVTRVEARLKACCAPPPWAALIG